MFGSSEYSLECKVCFGADETHMYFIAFFLLTAEGAEDTEEEKREEDGCWQIWEGLGFVVSTQPII
jgi:hypothetical protein